MRLIDIKVHYLSTKSGCSNHSMAIVPDLYMNLVAMAPNVTGAIHWPSNSPVLV